MLKRAIVLAALLGVNLVMTAVSAVSLSDPARSALSRFLHESVAKGDTPAVVAVVVDRDRELFLDAAGKRDEAANAPLPADAIFRIASMTKPVTSLAVMMLREQGKVHLGDSVTKYLPEFERRQVVATSFNDADATFTTRPAKRPVTIHDLLTHTSGISYAFTDKRLARFAAAGKPESDQPLIHDPGERFTYGTNTFVLGKVIEAVSGQPLEVFMRERIFEPLQMRDTFYAVPSDRVSRVVTLHQRRDATLVEQPNPVTVRSPVRGDGGLLSTASDYGRFMRLFLQGGRVGTRRLVTEESIRLMTSNQIGALTVVEQPTADPMRSRPFPIGAGKDTFGFGFQIEAAPAEPGMRSIGSYSWGGINNTHFWIDPKRQIGVAVLMQTLPYYDETALRILRGFERAVYANLK